MLLSLLLKMSTGDWRIFYVNKKGKRRLNKEEVLLQKHLKSLNATTSRSVIILIRSVTAKRSLFRLKLYVMEKIPINRLCLRATLTSYSFNYTERRSRTIILLISTLLF